MDYYSLSEIIAFSSLIPAIAAIFRYRNGLAIYRPFLLLIWIAAGNEILSTILSHIIKTNAINSNIYVFAEYVIFLWVFYRWNHSTDKKRYIILFAAGALIWVLDNFVLHSILSVNSLYRVFYSIILLYLSINQINKIIVYEKGKLFRNAMFLACCGIVLYYSYKSFVEAFYILELPFSRVFYLRFFQVLLFVDLFTNLIYTTAILCIPSKQEFSLR